MLLTKPFDAKLGLDVWTSSSGNKEMMPIITPAYPPMNSSFSASRQTLQIIHHELVKAQAIVEKIYNDKSSDETAWSELFQKSDFLINYPHYLSLTVVASNKSDLQSWTGFVESRLRKLVSDSLGMSLPLSKSQLWPKKFEICCASPNSKLSVAQKTNCCTFFIGFKLDRLRMRGQKLDLERQVQNFKDKELRRFQPAIEGCDVLTNYFTCKQLPPVVFDEFYAGGKKEAMEKRAKLRADDPVRIKRREEAAAAMKMETDEGKDAGGGSDAGGGTGTADEVAAADEGGGKAASSKEDDDALETALDTFVGGKTGAGAGKTREEAEADRKQLLAGSFVSDDVADNQLLVKLGLLTGEEEGGEVGKKIPLKMNVPGWREVDLKRRKKGRFQINVKTKFEGIIELTPDGLVVDKGDKDFIPSKKFGGRRGGFEFKMGVRGCGYYRTGVVPQCQNPFLAS